MKRCSCCKLEKELSAFCNDKTKIDGLSPRCKQCSSEQKKRYYSDPQNRERKRENQKRWYSNPENRERECEYQKRWYSDPQNKARKLEYQKRYYSDPKNKEREREYHKHYISDPENRGRKLEYHKRWYSDLENRARESENRKSRHQTDPMFKLRCNLSSRLWHALQCKSWTKISRTKDILGCTLPDLLQHLGPIPNYEYHIDHICPCAQAQTEEELYKLFHFTNLRYFPATENISKLDGWTKEGEALCLTLLGRPWVHDETGPNAISIS